MDGLLKNNVHKMTRKGQEVRKGCNEELYTN